MKHALIVGINNYKGFPLNYCVDDANSVSQILQDPEYAFQVEILLDERATTTNILKSLKQSLHDADDVMLFYFAGHGVANKYGSYLEAFDSVDREEDGIDLDKIIRVINADSKPTCAVVLLLDCCQSGACKLPESSTTVAIDADSLSQYLNVSSERKVLIAACKDTQLAEEIEKYKHGIFTQFLLEGLHGGASNESLEVTTNSLYDFIASEFERISAQRPVYRGDLNAPIILGENIKSKTLRKKENESESVARIAEQHLQSLHALVTPSLQSRSEWKKVAYLSACKQATPILDWFVNRRRERKSEVPNPRFQAAYFDLISKLRILYNLESGTTTEIGTLDNSVGFGSFGTVWKVKTSNGYQALKVFHGNDYFIDEKVSRFRNGFNAMRQLEHPHIVRVHQLFDCPLSFSMDWIEGANLRDWTWAITDPIDIIVLLLEITDTLYHSHARGVVHRDIKPENIIMSYDATQGIWMPYLTDFDLAWFSTATQQTRDALGTVFYAAPEQLAKPGSSTAHNQRVDIFSIGQIIYFLFTHSNPTPLDLADNVRALKERLHGWPRQRAAEMLVTLYEDCTKRDPDDRPRSMETVSNRLFLIKRALVESSQDLTLTFDDFVKEVNFAINGFNTKYADSFFYSPTGQTQIVLSSNSSYITVKFQVDRTPLIHSTPDFRRAVITMNERLDRGLRKFNVSRSSGRTSPYEAYINVKFNKLSLEMVGVIRSLIVTAIGILENG